ncbi:MAG: type II secretion system F family protein [Patescibacteria group bacterium]|nr:type II secretion system F family protein [Patescibacteria group bacterium]
MSHFTFKAKRPSGDVYSGERDAADRFELYKLIRESGDEIISLDETKPHKGLHMEISLFSRVKTVEKMNFARNLGLMLRAGLSLSRALSVQDRQSKNPAMKRVLADLIGDIDKGQTFADALSKHPKVFPQLFVAMVHAGEQSGTLSESLQAIAEQMDSNYTLSRRIKGAMIYPSVIIGVMIVIAILMMVFVVPTLMKVFTDMNVELPLATQIVLNISNVMQNDGIILLAAIILAALAFWRWSKKDSGKKVLHMLLIKSPIVGPLVQEVNAARTARTLSSLLSAGVEVVESVSITAAVVQNIYFKAVLTKAQEAIKKGDLMSKTFEKEGKLYPPFFAEMLSVGEETGKIGDMLGNVAVFYEGDVEQKTKDMSTIIEPVLIVLIGAAVGFFAVSMIQPMYSLVNVIH